MEYKNQNPEYKFAQNDNWSTYYKENMAALTVPPFSEQEQTEGKMIYFVNDTKRLIYNTPDQSDRINYAIGAEYDDIYNNGTIVRYFRNGTISVFIRDWSGQDTFQNNIKAPASMYTEAAYKLFN